MIEISYSLVNWSEPTIKSGYRTASGISSSLPDKSPAANRSIPPGPGLSQAQFPGSGLLEKHLYSYMALSLLLRKAGFFFLISENLISKTEWRMKLWAEWSFESTSSQRADDADKSQITSLSPTDLTSPHMMPVCLLLLLNCLKFLSIQLEMCLKNTHYKNISYFIWEIINMYQHIFLF